MGREKLNKTLKSVKLDNDLIKTIEKLSRLTKNGDFSGTVNDLLWKSVNKEDKQIKIEAVKKLNKAQRLLRSIGEDVEIKLIEKKDLNSDKK